MAQVHSKNSIVKLDNAAGSLTDITCFVTEVSGVDVVIDTVDTTTLCSTGQTNVPGIQQSSKVTLTGAFDTDTNADTLFRTLAVTNLGTLTDGSTVSFQFSPAGEDTGNPHYDVETWVTRYSPSAKVGDRVSFTLELTTNGPWSVTAF